MLARTGAESRFEERGRAWDASAGGVDEGHR